MRLRSSAGFGVRGRSRVRARVFISVRGEAVKELKVTRAGAVFQLVFSSAAHSRQHIGIRPVTDERQHR